MKVQARQLARRAAGYFRRSKLTEGEEGELTEHGTDPRTGKERRGLSGHGLIAELRKRVPTHRVTTGASAPFRSCRRTAATGRMDDAAHHDSTAVRHIGSGVLAYVPIPVCALHDSANAVMVAVGHST